MSKNKTFKKNILELKRISKNYGEINILKNVNCAFSKGSLNIIKGKNGAGKSTLLDILIGAKLPTKGEVLIEKDVKIGYVPSNINFDSITVIDFIKRMCGYCGIEFTKARKEIKEFMLTLNVYSFAFNDISSLSTGNKKKVMLVCALINDPDVIILDEPFANLDDTTVIDVQNMIEQWTKEEKTIIIVSHTTILAKHKKAIHYLLENGELEKLKAKKSLERLLNDDSINTFDSVAIIADCELPENKIYLKVENKLYFMKINTSKVIKLLSNKNVAMYEVDKNKGYKK